MIRYRYNVAYKKLSLTGILSEDVVVSSDESDGEDDLILTDDDDDGSDNLATIDQNVDDKTSPRVRQTATKGLDMESRESLSWWA